MIIRMKHAGPASLVALQPLLEQLRLLPGLKEPKAGVFYRRSRAFLHFHEDPAGLFADVRLTETFERFDVTTTAQQDALLQLVQNAVERSASSAVRRGR